MAALQDSGVQARHQMTGADRARDTAIRALDALNDRRDTESADYWVGYLSNALESVIFQLRAGA